VAAAAVLVAAGSGERLGAGGPKAFVELGGEPMLRHAVRAFLRSETVASLAIVVGSDEVARARATVADLTGPVQVEVCAGGATRGESVRCGLAALPVSAVLVAVHDAARPLISPALIRRVLAALEAPWSAAAPGLPVVDTLKLVDGERVLRTVDRRALHAVQTPQVFSRRTLDQVHSRLQRPGGSRTATDDLVLVEEAGGRVRLVRGEQRNLKITYPEDLRLAEALLAADRAERARRADQ
jgi:2-C-methyl-D-erythritol 4-phosphate cytidylyltransferase